MDKKMDTSLRYNEYFIPIWNEASRRGMDQNTFMKRCGMQKQMFTKYHNGLGITAPKLAQIMEGMALTIEKVETISGIPMPADKKRVLRRQVWLRNNTEIVDILMDNPTEAERIKENAQRIQ